MRRSSDNITVPKELITDVSHVAGDTVVRVAQVAGVTVVLSVAAVSLVAGGVITLLYVSDWLPIIAAAGTMSIGVTGAGFAYAKFTAWQRNQLTIRSEPPSG